MFLPSRIIGLAERCVKRGKRHRFTAILKAIFSSDGMKTKRNRYINSPTWE